jgi:FKBP-type peptidyl-prolyl cis-trans isomerase
MKRIYKLSIFAAAVMSLAGCAKAVTEGQNEAIKRAFDAWLQEKVINAGEEAVREGRGIYVLPEYTKDGDGAKVETDGFAIMRYTIRDLNGNITSYTNKEYAEQLGTYSPASYYGVQVQTTTAETIRAGVADAIIGMKVGGKKKFIVPSWLMSYSNFDSEQEYLDSDNESSSAIYEIEIVDFAKNINNWQLDRIVECINKPDFYDGAFNGTEVKDSTSLGFYFKMLNKVESEKEFSTDTTIYINYTGRLLDLPELYGDGQVFDTTVENIAKDNYIYSSSKAYSPATIKWGETHSDITLGGSNVVSGFSQTLWNMVNCAPGTKAVGVFYSDLGYGYSGSGTIPTYAPLVFEIEIVEKPE